jgi:hypothetical protein
VSDTVQIPIDPAELQGLADRLRALLSARTASEPLWTYRDAAHALGLKPPHTIHRVILALEHTMREDAAAGRPFIAARVISRARDGLPAPGFFVLAQALGRHDGDEAGARARAFHAAELAALAEGLRTPGRGR